MKNKSLLAVLSLSLGVALACGGGETTATPPTPPPPPTTTAAPADGSVGVAQCDEYIKKMTECLATMDATAKATVESSFKQTTDAWRQAAATEAGKAGLAVGCQAALDSMASMPCGGSTTTTTTTTTTTATTGDAAATAGAGGVTATAGGTTATVTPSGVKVETKTETTKTETTTGASGTQTRPADMSRGRPGGSGNTVNSTGGSSGGSSGGATGGKGRPQ